MEAERSSSTFDKESLAALVHSYTHPGILLNRVREIRQKCVQAGINFPLEYYYENREASVVRSVKYSLDLQRFLRTQDIMPNEEPIVYQSAYGLHSLNLSFNLMLASLAIQATPEQVADWLPRIKSLEIIGCYAQTELGHGSYVKGIETEAVYDHNTQEFVINSPTVSSYKWWIGALGLCSNFALIIAQLKISGKNIGPHAFFIQIRDLNSHTPLAGVQVGDIGPKMGMDHLDNGYLKFTNFRVPKKSMLNKFSIINDKGKYELLDKNGIKILYLSLVSSRLGIIIVSWFALAAALTISIRYSIFRQQFKDPEKKNTEKKLLDYQIQQYKLFVPLGFLYGVIFSRQRFLDTFECAKQEVSVKKGGSLQFTHAIMALFKYFFTDNCCKFIEQARVSCGGHGYLKTSGLPTLYLSSIPATTYEGDNSVLALQAIKYIVSLHNKTQPELLRFLFTVLKKPSGPIETAEFQQDCIEAVTQMKLKSLIEKYIELMAKFGHKEKIWNDFLQVEGIETAELIAHSLFHRFYLEECRKINNEQMRKSVESLRVVYIGNVIDKFRADLIGLGVKGLPELKQLSLNALTEIRKNALVLIEAFELPDELLNTAIGRKNGDAYKTLFEENEKLNSLNKNSFAKSVKALIPKI